MLRKESTAVPEGNGAVPQQEESGSGQPTVEDVYRMMKEVFEKRDTQMDELLLERRTINQRLTRLEPDARQPRLAMEPNGPANTKTRQRMEDTATALQAMYGDSFSACRVDPGPMTKSASFGMMAEPPALPCRDGVVVESGDAAPKSRLPSLDIRSPTAAGGLLPTGKTSTAIKTTYNRTLLRLYATKKTNPKEKKLRTSISSALYDSSFWKLRAAPSCLRVIETKPMQNSKIGRSIQAVLEIVFASTRFWDDGARCFVVRLSVLEQLDETAAVFGGSMVRDSNACRRAVGATYECRMYSG